MLIILSPAKRLDVTPAQPPLPPTDPRFADETAALVAKLRTFSAGRLAKLMALSPELAALNHARFQHWGQAAEKAAVLMFDGEAYRGLDAPSLDAGDLRFAQRHLRLLSGLYGVLRPLDRIAPYRLEMGTRLSMGKGRKDLYAFWGHHITDALNEALQEHQGDVLVNLASEEYARSIHFPRLKAQVITPVFKERGPKGLRMVAVFAKQQRGAMARWAIQRRLAHPPGLKEYDGDGYRFDPAGDTDGQWLFVR